MTTALLADQAVLDRRKQRMRRVVNLTIIVMLFLVSLAVILPLIWMVSTSLRIPRESFTLPPQWIPLVIRPENYAEVFELAPFGNYILNSLKITLSIVAGHLVTSSMAAYAFARLRFPFKNVLFMMLMSALMVPLFVTIIPIFVLIRNLGLVDTHGSLILPALITPFGVFLLRQFYMTIPLDLEEAAKIDGAGPFKIYRHIFLPLGAPALAVLGILSFNTYWNEFFRPLIFLTDYEKFTVPLGIVTLRGFMNTGSISVVLAGVTIALIPTVIIFIIVQRYLVEGIVMTGVKG